MNANPWIHRVRQIDPGAWDETVARGITLAHFCEPWFAPCQMQLDVLERVAAEIGCQATIVEINIDQARDLAVRLQVDRIPTLLLFKDGRLLRRLPGLHRESRLEKEIRAVAGE